MVAGDYHAGCRASPAGPGFTSFRMSEPGVYWPRSEKSGEIIAIKPDAGGDWDFLIGEIRAPSSGKICVFEGLLGFSSHDPRPIEKFWKRVKGLN